MRKIGLLLAIWAFTFCSNQAYSALIAEHTTAAFLQDQFIPGQSLTTPGPSAWNNLRFNWFSDIAATTPTAFGSLFLLSQEYLGAPSALSPLTPGFVAESQSIASGRYVFDPGVTIDPSTQYFVYASEKGLLAGQTVGTYGDGILYSDNGLGPNAMFFQFADQDAAFRLEGRPTHFVPTSVPEPSALAFWSLTAAIALSFSRRRVRSR